MWDLLLSSKDDATSLGVSLRRLQTKTGFIEVREFSNWRWIHFGSPEIQSLMDMHRPAHPALDYSAAMLYGLVLHQRPQTVLSLGSGAGTFERFFQHYLPEVGLESVESCEAMTGLAREFFLLPPRVQPVHMQAAAFLATSTMEYDLILCDLFGFRGHPDDLYSTEFYANCYARLAAEGVLVVNLLAVDQETVLPVLLSIREYFNWVSLYDVPGCKNVILYCCVGSPRAMGSVAVRAQQLSKTCGVDFCRLSTAIVSLPEPRHG